MKHIHTQTNCYEQPLLCHHNDSSHQQPYNIQYKDKMPKQNYKDTDYKITEICYMNP